MDQSELEEVVAVVASRSVFAGRCWAASLAVDQVCCCKKFVFAALEGVRRSMTAEVYPADLAGIHVVPQRTEYARSQVHSARLFQQQHHRQGVESSLGEQLALVQWEQRDCMPWVQAAVAAVVVKLQLRPTVLMLVALGTSVSMRCSLL